MFEKILNRFGYITKKESLQLRAEVIGLEELVRTQDRAIGQYQQQMKALAGSRVVDMNIGDPAPEDVDARREYIMRVAAFFKDTLEPKIRSMISSVREELEKVENSVTKDQLLKGTCNALWLIYDWGELAVSEAMSYRTEDLPKE